jgi:hypothetical protein
MNLRSLRRIAVSRAIAAGADVAVVARRFGHSSPAVTLTLYTHASEERARASAARGSPRTGQFRRGSDLVKNRSKESGAFGNAETSRVEDLTCPTSSDAAVASPIACVIWSSALAAASTLNLVSAVPAPYSTRAWAR